MVSGSKISVFGTNREALDPKPGKATECDVLDPRGVIWCWGRRFSTRGEYGFDNPALGDLPSFGLPVSGRLGTAPLGVAELVSLEGDFLWEGGVAVAERT